VGVARAWRIETRGKLLACADKNRSHNGLQRFGVDYFRIFGSGLKMYSVHVVALFLRYFWGYRASFSRFFWRQSLRAHRALGGARFGIIPCFRAGTDLLMARRDYARRGCR